MLGCWLPQGPFRHSPPGQHAAVLKPGASPSSLGRPLLEDGSSWVPQIPAGGADACPVYSVNTIGNTKKCEVPTCFRVTRAVLSILLLMKNVKIYNTPLSDASFSLFLHNCFLPSIFFNLAPFVMQQLSTRYMMVYICQCCFLSSPYLYLLLCPQIHSLGGSLVPFFLDSTCMH